MSNLVTKKMLTEYEQSRKPTTFLMGLFNSPEENFHNSESVEIDIERYDEDVAVAVTDLTAGYNFNKLNVSTNKEFIPPLFKEAFSLNQNETIARSTGSDPFQDPIYVANALKKFKKGMIKISDKIVRAVELQASQVLQSATATLKNENGDNVYEIDYKPKATHFPAAASPAWDGTNPTIAANIESLLDVIKSDGQMSAHKFVSIWGGGAFSAAMADTPFRTLFDSTIKIDAGSIGMPGAAMNGAIYRGTIAIGPYTIEIWTYDAEYKDVETLAQTKYIETENVVFFDPQIRLEMTWGNVPMILKPEQRVMPYVPPRIVSPGMGGIDMITNIWTDDMGENLFGGISARPLAIPVAIDRFGCLDSGV